MAKRPYTLPSGFVFPHFQYTENTLVRIKDLTDYKEAVELDGKNTFNQASFDHYFDSEYMLELEIETFQVMFKVSTLKKLGVKQPPSGWPAFHEECFWKKEDEEPLVWSKTKQVHKHLHMLGLLDELQPTKELLQNHLFNFTVAKLKDMAKKQGVKTTGNKSELIENLIKNGKIKTPTFLTVSNKYWPMVHRLAQAYMQDIENQLKDKPNIYKEAIDFLLEEDEMLQAALL